MTSTTSDKRWFSLSRGTRKLVLTTHIIASVALLGDSAGFLAVAIRSANDPDMAAAGWEILNMFGAVFGIPLSATALLTGLILGLGSKWGVLKYPWVTTKLLLILSVMLVGTFVIGPAEVAVRQGSETGQIMLIAAGAWDVAVLAVAVILSVYKPGRRWKRQSA